MHIMIRKSDKEVLKRVSYQTPPSDELLLQGLVNELGGEKSDYVIYKNYDKEVSKRVMDHESFDLVLNAKGEVADIDFSPQDSKLWIDFSLSKPTLLADGEDSTTLTITMLKADESGPEETFNQTLTVPILFNSAPILLEVTFVEGVATYPITAGIKWSGIFTIPSYDTSLSAYRLKNRVTLTARLSNLTLV